MSCHVTTLTIACITCLNLSNELLQTPSLLEPQRGTLMRRRNVVEQSGIPGSTAASQNLTWVVRKWPSLVLGINSRTMMWVLMRWICMNYLYQALFEYAHSNTILSISILLSARVVLLRCRRRALWPVQEVWMHNVRVHIHRRLWTQC